MVAEGIHPQGGERQLPYFQTILRTDSPDISKDGALTGVNTQLYTKLADLFEMDIIASGGVHTMDDLVALAHTGVSGTVLGRALYTGSIDLKTAIAEIDKVKV